LKTPESSLLKTEMSKLSFQGSKAENFFKLKEA